jgi:hypothetical protein
MTQENDALISILRTDLEALKRAYLETQSNYVDQTKNALRNFNPVAKLAINNLYSNLERILDLNQEILTFYQVFNIVFLEKYGIPAINYHSVHNDLTSLLRLRILFSDIESSRLRLAEEAAEVIDDALTSCEVMVPYLDSFRVLVFAFTKTHDFIYEVTSETMLELMTEYEENVLRLLQYATKIHDRKPADD